MEVVGGEDHSNQSSGVEKLFEGARRHEQERWRWSN